ncbi:hypothetical protein CesoFtcFv8_004151 [Champsocephalus esox]|uniref:Uncharacterized protein n=1 Tax=Champsocephalus esox TaxID=159716 RepID=A0AAN8CY06_9TELE|nr:hypothetical protein CesoFtcFv8_004151 [Champsocephalus esox]
MDAHSHLFFGLERKNGQRRLMHSLRSNAGQLLQVSADIRQCAVGFYKELYRTEFQKWRSRSMRAFLTSLRRTMAGGGALCPGAAGGPAEHAEWEGSWHRRPACRLL